MLPPRREKEKPTSVEGAASDNTDDEPDDWDKRINDTGCSVENDTLRDCFFDRKDWRLCKAEMATFKECWAKHGNSKRTAQADM